MSKCEFCTEVRDPYGTGDHNYVVWECAESDDCKGFCQRCDSGIEDEDQTDESICKGCIEELEGEEMYVCTGCGCDVANPSQDPADAICGICIDAKQWKKAK